MTTIRLSRPAPLFALLATLGASLAGGCACTRDSSRSGSASPPSPAFISHVVLFRLHDPADAPALIVDSHESLGKIPAVASLACGRHAEAGRSNISTDYDVAVYVGFDSLEDYAAYVADPRHVDLVDRWKDRFAGYTVYDFFDEAPGAPR